MPLKIHQIDPDYDTVIILDHPCKAFAPWDPTAEISEHVVSELPLESREGPVIKLEPSNDGRAKYDDDWGYGGETRKSKKKGKRRLVKADRSENAPSVWNDSETAVEASWPGEEELLKVAEASNNAAHVPSSEGADIAKSRTQVADLEEEIVHYRVSSRHLTLASPWFKRALTSPGSKEAVPNPTDGRFYVPASDWDEEAFLILLNIFHLRKRSIPETVSLEMLAKIAVLVDYYELKGAEAIEHDVDIWINHVRQNYAVPTSYGRDLVLWMCISAVFDLPTVFEEATAVSIQESTGSIQDLGLPIPLRATGDIDHKRVQAIDHIISGLHRLLGNYHNPDYSCPHGSYSFYCGAFLFGALYKEMERWGFLAPRPEGPFLGLSFKGVCSKIDAVRSPRWYEGNNYSSGRSRVVDRPCSLKRGIDSIVEDSTKNVGGLKLSDLKGGE